MAARVDRPAVSMAGRRADGSQACGGLACGTHWIADTDFVIVDVETTGWLPEDAGSPRSAPSG